MAGVSAVEELFTIKETAKLMKLSDKTIIRCVLANPPRLRSVKIGKSRRIPASAVQEMLDRGMVSAA